MSDFTTFTTNWEQQSSSVLDDLTTVSNDMFDDDWQTGAATAVDDSDFDIMEVEHQINLLEDDLLQDPCVSPTGPIEELMTMELDDDDAPFLEYFEDFMPSTISLNDSTSSLPFDERYKATLSKLQESMKRSQETRKSLKIKTTKIQDYETRNLSGVLSSIERSTEQLQDYLQSLKSATAA